jgi:hypothetical protein
VFALDPVDNNGDNLQQKEYHKKSKMEKLDEIDTGDRDGQQAA